MLDDIKDKFGFHAVHVNQDRLIIILLPPGQKRAGKEFQVDIYGFELDRPSNGLLYFPWDMVTFAMHDFLPLVKHKLIVSDYDDNKTDLEIDDNQFLYYYMPFNVPCLLPNLYGEDFMTPLPKKGYSLRRIAYNNTRREG